MGIHIVGDPNYGALHTWIRELVRDLPQAPRVIEMTNQDPWRMHVVPSGILFDPLYMGLTDQEKVRYAHVAMQWINRKVIS